MQLNLRINKIATILYKCKTEDIEKIIAINKHGMITLPKDLRRKYILEQGGQLAIEESEDGLLLRAELTHAIEIYSDQRIREFEQHNEDELAGFNLIC